MNTLIVSEIFPLRPYHEAQGAMGRTDEARVMRDMITRLNGKLPNGLRISLLAGKEKIVVFFRGDNVQHWQYVTGIEKKWPKKWDWRAIMLMDKKEKL